MQDEILKEVEVTKMSKLDELINKLCPNGVEFKELGQVLNIKNGKDYKQFSEGNIPVYGSGGVIAYINTAMYNKPSVLIPRKGSLKNLYYIDIPFWNVDTIFYTEINTNIITPKYVYYCLKKQCLEKLNKAGGVPSLTQSVLVKIKIPVPPLEVQKEIVAILDRFDGLCNDICKGLPAEIKARQEQHEYYRDKLLDFKDKEVEFKSIGSLITRITDKGKKSKNINQVYVVSNSRGMVKAEEYRENTVHSEDTSNYILMHPGMFAYNPSRLNIGSIALLKDNSPGLVSPMYVVFSVDENKIIKEYLEYNIKSSFVKNKIDSLKEEGARFRFDFNRWNYINIPIPPIEEQRRIVNILDKFTQLTAELNAELTARRKQYEYYRDKLLTFKRLA